MTFDSISGTKKRLQFGFIDSIFNRDIFPETVEQRKPFIQRVEKYLVIQSKMCQMSDLIYIV